MAELTKQHGVCGADVKPLSDDVYKIPSPSFNWSVGNGGIPEEASILLYGAENGGKSLINQLILIAIQKKYPDGICAHFDPEYSFRPEWFAQLGGDNNRLYLRRGNDPVKIFDYIERDLADKISQGCPIKSISIDSIRAIKFPKDNKEVSTKAVMGGAGAAYLTAALKSILPVQKDNRITTIFVQQVYEEMDEYKKKRNPYVVPDGRALKHWADIMIQVDRMQTKAGSIEMGTTIAGTQMQIGHLIRTKCTKNRLSGPYRVAEFELRYGKGIINQDVELYNLAKSLGVIKHGLTAEGKENNKSWVFKDRPPIIGEDNMIEYVKSDPKLQEEMLEACYKVTESDIAAMNSKVEIAEAPEISFEA